MTQRDQLNSADPQSGRLSSLKVWLSRLLISGGVLLAVVVVTTSLALILQSAGDHAGAAAVRGLAWVAAVFFAIILLALLSSLALAVLQLLDQAADSAECSQLQQSPTGNARSDELTD